MNEAPFLGRTPVFCGDDISDEDGFAVVNARGGVSIRVGEGAATRAAVQAGTVAELRDWLTRVASAAAGHRLEPRPAPGLSLGEPGNEPLVPGLHAVRPENVHRSPPAFLSLLHRAS